MLHTARYRNLQARAKRAAKEATVGKGKRVRKRKSPAPEPGAPDPKAKVARMSEAQVAEDGIAARGMENRCSVLQFGSVS